MLQNSIPMYHFSLKELFFSTKMRVTKMRYEKNKVNFKMLMKQFKNAEADEKDKNTNQIRPLKHLYSAAAGTAKV